MLKYAYTLMVQSTTGVALFFAMAGLSWIDQGYGIHPMTAGVIATVALLIPYLVAQPVLGDCYGDDERD